MQHLTLHFANNLKEMYAMNYIFNQYDTNMLKIRIKYVRKLRGETQQSLADKLGVRRQTIINWEKKKDNDIPSIENLVDLCETLDCSMDYLLGSVDTPEIEPISKASHYSGISAEIIRYGLENPEFLDCLNFFMHPDNSSKLFNSITLNAWKKHYIDSSIENINGELRELLIKYYDEYISITPFAQINKKTYRAFLESKLPEKKLSTSTSKTETGIKIKMCFSLITYQNFYNGKEFNYSAFITYLIENTFEPLSHRIMIELQKMKLSTAFAELFIRYINE